MRHLHERKDAGFIGIAIVAVLLMLFAAGCQTANQRRLRLKCPPKWVLLPSQS